MKLKTNHIAILITFMFLCMMLNSCGTKKNMPTSTVSSTKTHFESNNNQGKTSNSKITIPQDWQTLDIELNSHDNKKLYQELKGWLGVPYQHGGNTKNGVDCSGLVVAVYKKIYHIILQRVSAQIFEKNCRPIPVNDLKEGDLVFFSTTKGSSEITHVGIYLKDNKFVHASSSRGVMVNDLRQSYYKRHFATAGRVI